MRISSLVLTAALVIAPDVRGQSVHATSGVIKVLPDPTIKMLVGCWREKGEPDRWIFRRKGSSGMAVIHETDAETAGALTDVMFNPAANSYAFVATGWGHRPQLLVFVIRASAIEVWFYSSHHSRGYHWTGRHALFGRCPRA